MFFGSPLLSLFAVGYVSKGAKGSISDCFRSACGFWLYLFFGKIFFRRHVQIAHIRHIIVSGVYAGILTRNYNLTLVQLSLSFYMAWYGTHFWYLENTLPWYLRLASFLCWTLEFLIQRVPKHEL
jgi:hypothetical protein